MSVLDEFETWVTLHEAEFSDVGTVSLSRGSHPRDKRSVHLSIEGPRDSFELLIWDSGEAELNQLVHGQVTLDHVVFDGPAEFEHLLDRFLQSIGRQRR